MMGRSLVCFLLSPLLLLLSAEHEIESRGQRPTVMPAQATAYKIGMMKIMGLREQARQRRGGRFGIREFHDGVLPNGAVPLSVLESMVNEWAEPAPPAGPEGPNS